MKRGIVLEVKGHFEQNLKNKGTYEKSGILLDYNLLIVWDPKNFEKKWDYFLGFGSLKIILIRL